jgi:hypothetical protein
MDGTRHGMVFVRKPRNRECLKIIYSEGKQRTTILDPESFGQNFCGEGEAMRTEKLDKEMERAIKIIWTWATFEIETGYKTLSAKNTVELLKPIVERIKK